MPFVSRIVFSPPVILVVKESAETSTFKIDEEFVLDNTVSLKKPCDCIVVSGSYDQASVILLLLLLFYIATGIRQSCGN